MYTPRLSCILTGLEKNYQRRALSKQTNIQIKRLFSSKVPKSAKHELCVAINPLFITGFADGESCFGIVISKNNRLNTG